jgi:hypothetical protein
METEPQSESLVQSTAGKKGFSGLQVFGLIILTIVVTAFIGWWVVRTYIFPAQLAPVDLSQLEQVELDRKLTQLGFESQGVVIDDQGRETAVPTPYSEDSSKRNVTLSERELNSLLAGDPNLADRIAIDLDNDLASIVALIPIPEDFPIMPGRTVRVRGGAEIAYRGGQPVVILKGVSVMGVPIPNAWLGDLKNIDLAQRFGGADGFWGSFSRGVEAIQILDGKLQISVKE